MIFLHLVLLIFGSSIAIENCCDRSDGERLLVHYLQAIRNQNREQLFDILSEDFKFINCDGSVQSREQVFENIRQINVYVDTRKFSIHSNYTIMDNIFRFWIWVINSNRTYSKNHYEAKTINGELRLVSERIESCFEPKQITTTLLDHNLIGRRLALKIEGDYLLAIRTKNRELLFKTVTDDFKLLSCEQKYLTAEELLKPENLNKIPVVQLQSEFDKDFGNGLFNFHLGEPNKPYSVFYTAWDQKEKRYRLKQHMLFDCEAEEKVTAEPKIDDDSGYSKKIAKVLFYKYYEAITLLSFHRFSKVVARTFDVIYVDGKNETLEDRTYFYRTINYDFYQPNENRTVLNVQKISKDGSFVFEANVNGWNHIEFRVRKVNGTFLIVSERHINNNFQLKRIDIKTIDINLESIAMESAEELFSDFRRARRQNNLTQLFEVISTPFEITDLEGNTTVLTKESPDIFNAWDKSSLNYEVFSVINDGADVLGFYAEKDESVKRYKVKKIDNKLYLTSEIELTTFEIDRLFYDIPGSSP